MMNFKRLWHGAFAALALSTAFTAQAEWKPTQQIHYVAGVAQGSTVDLYDRDIKHTIESLNLFNDQVAVVENKPGAGSALALREPPCNPGNGQYMASFRLAAEFGLETQ